MFRIELTFAWKWNHPRSNNGKLSRDLNHFWLQLGIRTCVSLSSSSRYPNMINTKSIMVDYLIPGVVPFEILECDTSG